MLLVLPVFRRGAGVAAMLSLMVLLPLSPGAARAQANPAQALAPQVANTRHARPDTGELWKRRDQQDYARMQEGIDAYRKQAYPRAIDLFSGLDGADAQYNLGNALANAGRLDDAIAAYDRALALQPGMTDALANRKVVDAARKRKPPPGGGSGQKQQKDPQQDQSQHKQKDGQAGDQPGDQPDKQDPGGQDSKQNQSRPGKPDQSANAPKPGQSPSQQEAPEPQDAKTQAAADGAQRKRMQEALGKKTPDAKSEQKTEATSETPEQRERRLANQAQLQRVPDDPGALLRARFRLEYERRRQPGSGQ